MTALAKHLKIARNEGVEAGLDAYMSAPISKQYPLFDEINRKRTINTKLAAYCNHFGLVNDANGVIEDRKIDDVQQNVPIDASRFTKPAAPPQASDAH